MRASRREGERSEGGGGETWGVITMNVICLSCRPFILAEVEQELPQRRGSKSQPNGRRLQFKGRCGARSKQGRPRSKEGGARKATEQQQHLRVRQTGFSTSFYLVFFLLPIAAAKILMAML